PPQARVTPPASPVRRPPASPPDWQARRRGSPDGNGRRRKAWLQAPPPARRAPARPPPVHPRARSARPSNCQALQTDAACRPAPARPGRGLPQRTSGRWNAWFNFACDINILTHLANVGPGFSPGLCDTLDGVGNILIEHMGIAQCAFDVGVVQRLLRKF